MKRAVGLVLGMASLVVGCEQLGMNPPLKKMSKQDMVNASARRSYQEVRRDKEILVVSTYDAKKRVKEGKEPVTKVAAIGFGPKGEKVIFEASKDGALEQALMTEFDRRHGRAAEQQG